MAAATLDCISPSSLPIWKTDSNHSPPFILPPPNYLLPPTPFKAFPPIFPHCLWSVHPHMSIQLYNVLPYSKPLHMLSESSACWNWTFNGRRKGFKNAHLKSQKHICKQCHIDPICDIQALEKSWGMLLRIRTEESLILIQKEVKRWCVALLLLIDGHSWLFCYCTRVWHWHGGETGRWVGDGRSCKCDQCVWHHYCTRE